MKNSRIWLIVLLSLSIFVGLSYVVKMDADSLYEDFSAGKIDSRAVRYWTYGTFPQEKTPNKESLDSLSMKQVIRDGSDVWFIALVSEYEEEIGLLRADLSGDPVGEYVFVRKSTKNNSYHPVRRLGDINDHIEDRPMFKLIDDGGFIVLDAKNFEFGYLDEATGEVEMIKYKGKSSDPHWVDGCNKSFVSGKFFLEGRILKGTLLCGLAGVVDVMIDLEKKKIMRLSDKIDGCQGMSSMCSVFGEIDSDSIMVRNQLFEDGQLMEFEIYRYYFDSRDFDLIGVFRHPEQRFYSKDNSRAIYQSGIDRVFGETIYFYVYFDHETWGKYFYTPGENLGYSEGTISRKYKQNGIVYE